MFRKLNSDSSTNLLRFYLIFSIVLFAAAVRILPHPWNFTPIGAMALFSGAKIPNRWAAFLLPLSALFLGDLFVGLHKLIPIVYLSFVLSVLIGRYFRTRQTILGISAATLLGAAQFFLITNFAIWAYGFTPYGNSLSGLFTCYLAGIPYFANTLAGDAVYAAVLFGVFALAERFSPAFRSHDAASAA